MWVCVGMCVNGIFVTLCQNLSFVTCAETQFPEVCPTIDARRPRKCLLFAHCAWAAALPLDLWPDRRANVLAARLRLCLAWVTN